VGWAVGIERVLLASSGERPAQPPAIFVAIEDADGSRRGFRLLTELRAAGIGAHIEQAGRSLKGQLKHADRLDARWVVIVGASELAVRDMRSGEQRSAADSSEVVRMLTEAQ